MRTLSSFTVAEIFRAFFKLGCISFGGPVAHLGFFQEEFVSKRRWFTDAEYADMVALCQFLPGPSSSQVGFAIGLRQCGVAGGFAAWLGFTLPSAVLMICFALGVASFGDISGMGWIVGLKLAAVVIVADAIWSMSVKLCPDAPRIFLALGSAALLTVFTTPVWQPVVIALGALAGWLLFRNKTDAIAKVPTTSTTPGRGWVWLALFACLSVFLGMTVAQHPSGWLVEAEGFFRAGALVFGGGHVVLPLLESFAVGLGGINQDAFLAGYGAAQALPGPLFAFAAYLGALSPVGSGGVIGGIFALIAIYVPSWLLVLGTYPYWRRLSGYAPAQAALYGANAAVVGLLIAAFFNPVWSMAVTSSARLAFVLLAFAVFRYAKLPVWAFVIACALAGALLF